MNFVANCLHRLAHASYRRPGKLAGLLFALAFGAVSTSAHAVLIFTFTDQGDDLLVDLSGTLNTSGLSSGATGSSTVLKDDGNLDKGARGG